MACPEDVASSVEACLAQTWEFLTGDAMAFRVVDKDFAIPEPLLHYFIRLSPAAASWTTGAILSLATNCLEEPDLVAAEICNVCSGCVRRIFPQRNEFDVGLPVTLGAEQVARLLASVRVVRCYASDRQDVRFLAFESDRPLEMPCV